MDFLDFGTKAEPSKGLEDENSGFKQNILTQP